MTEIKQITGTITHVEDISPSARVYTITPYEPLPFVAGAFVNLFVQHEGKFIRRAFSLSSSDRDDDNFTLSIRLSLNGELTPILWNKDFTGETVKIMGPLGLNTAGKMHSNKVYLFGFGIGAGVVKSLADHMIRRNKLESLTIVTGNRSVEEILHKDYFDTLKNDEKVSVQYVVSNKEQTLYPTGYIQEHIGDYNFDDADIYMCGQGVACDALHKTILKTNPQNYNFFIEDFH